MYPSIKRALDIMFSLLIGVLFIPFGVLIALWIKLDSKGPVLFRQERIGRGCKPFFICKFRTMRLETEKDGVALPDSVRTTNSGALLRKLSLDEIPQVINIIKGEMSFIGPRPLLVRYLPYYTPHENKRHLVRPGITGLAQVNGRNLLDWNSRLAMDAKYATEYSFGMDCRILVQTIKKVFRTEDIVDRDANAMLDLDEERRQNAHS